MSSRDLSRSAKTAVILTAAKNPRIASLLVPALLFTATLAAHATLPEWLQHVVGASSIETALFRGMQLPQVQALYPRPPKEAQAELAHLISAAPNDAQLYALRAQSDEAALDFTAAEADWKHSVAHSPDPIAAKLQLAEFYHRRLLAPQELAVLGEVAAAPPIASERFAAANEQRSWQTFERMLALIADQGLAPAQTDATYKAFLTRYPEQPAVYAQFLAWQLTQKDWPAAEALIARYQTAFPKDAIFPIRALALLEYRRGNIDRALAVYDRSFQPLWPAELVQAYFGLLQATHRERAFVADARNRLAEHPDGPEALNALARIFYYDQQAGRLDKAQQTLDGFRIAREARNRAWTPTDLATLAELSSAIHSYAEAARYDFALASAPGNVPSGEPAAQAGLAALVDLLLSAPEQPLALGAGNLSMYRDIATLDQGPGYWNGILSLWMNGSSPDSEYNAENAKAQSYFHRAKAVELLTELDAKFPAAPERAGLHAQLVRTYVQYGETEAVIAAGRQFLDEFKNSPERVEIAGLMADAYARQKNTAAEFALYDALLAELAAKTGGMPLTAGSVSPPAHPTPNSAAANQNPAAAMRSASYELNSYTPPSPLLPEAVEYAQVLDRYIGRLVAEKQLPQALAVLRRQLDLNPNDPLLYERLANFLEQNSLSGQQEAMYREAIARFHTPGWYDKLARLYLRQRNRQAYVALTHQVADIFSGTDLDTWFRGVGSLPVFSDAKEPAAGPQLALQLNLYAQRRFPHDLVFTHNLLHAYQAKPTADAAAYDDLLRRHWWESDDLRAEFFAYLARTGKLQAELAQLQPIASASDAAATRELAEIDIWTSHFEAAAPLMGSVADLYPADATTGDQAVSLFRSLAYLDPTLASTKRAVAIESGLSASDPADAERLATLGDLYAEATATGGEDIRAAAPYWRRIPTLHAGTPAGYLTAATVFWDYFQFDDALAEIRAARTRFHEPALYGYEAGAIAENRREMAEAVAEYTAAATHPPSADGEPADNQARSRLLQLATRPATRTAVDAATAKALAQEPASLAALNLRADVLVAQHREPELAPLLDAALSRADTVDELSAIGALAEQHALTATYDRSLEREIALTTDPVQKIQLSYTWSASLESHKDTAGAARIIDSVYRDNPRILGVVRATTDFYARTGQPPRAIATLLAAARVATPDLARNFTLEAAQKANESGDTQQARALAEAMLPANPYDATVLGIVAASYARANDDAGLKAFYLAQLAAVKSASLTPAERRDDTALLRRGLIPALTRLKDYDGATAQYIALLSAYPEDSSTAQEAALYALRYGRQPQLLGFLRTTVRQSPRDSRFMILLAQVETTFDDLPGAVAAYSQAIALRKDRTDLYSARADLELRLGLSDPAQVDAAAADFQRLYVLSYKDPSWMVRLGELRARQGRAADAVQALTTAWITGQTVTAARQFRVADQLAQWNLLAEARSFALKGIATAGKNLLTEPDSGAATYARVLTRLGKPDEALATLAASNRAVQADTSFPAAIAAAYAKQGVSARDIASARQAYIESRRQTARQQLDQAVAAIGQTIQTYDTPEQKLAYAQTLDRMHATNPALALTAASAAGLNDRDAEWRKQILLAAPIDPHALPDSSAYEALERRRLDFAALAQTLEAYAARVPATARPAILDQAAQAYREAGDEKNELRLTRPLVLAQQNGLRDRLFDLLLRLDRPGLIALAASRDDALADAAANYAVAHMTQAQALAAIDARSRGLDPVWRPAVSSLVLTNFATSTVAPTASNLASFTQPLNTDASIAARLAKPANTSTQLTGDNWFHYAKRFGIFLATVPHAPALPDAADYLDAELESAPTAVGAYLRLARNQSDAGNLAGAIVEYNHALELAPNNPAVRDEFAVVLFRANQRAEATAQWHAAFALLAKRQTGEEFFSTFKSLVVHLHQRDLFAAFRPDLESVLRPYFARNGNYRSNELLEAIYDASATPAVGTAFLLTVSGYAADPNLLLEALRNAAWIRPESREAILLRQIELERNKPAGASDSSPQGARGYQFDLLALYLDRNQLAKAQALFDAVNSTLQKSEKPDEMDRILLAVRGGRVQTLLKQWREQPDSVPSQTDFDSALYRLRRPTPDYRPDPAAIRPLQEFVFERKQLNHELQPTDFLALAQVRIDTGDLPGALDLLHRLALRPPSTYENGAIQFDGPPEYRFAFGAPMIQYKGADVEVNPFANTDYAAALLEATGHSAEAMPFLQSLAQSVPWDPRYRLRLGEARLKSAQPHEAEPLLTALASDASAPYALRLQAASDLGSITAKQATPSLGSQELNLLADNPHPSPAAARQPYFAAARFAAAAADSVSKPDRIALLHEAVAIDPAGPMVRRALLDLLLAQTATDSASATLALYSALGNAPAAHAAPAADEMQSDTEAATPGETPEDPTEMREPSGRGPVVFPFALPHPLDRPTQIRLAVLLASAFNREHNTAQSLAFDRLAVNLDAMNPRPDPVVVKRLKDYEATLALEKKNALRRPLIHAGLDQPNNVRPRLTLADQSRAETP
jgi:tetratricopeptide (TPR) repeat protein